MSHACGVVRRYIAADDRVRAVELVEARYAALVAAGGAALADL